MRLLYAFACGCLMGAFIATRVIWWWLSDKAVIPRELFLSTEAASERPTIANPQEK